MRRGGANAEPLSEDPASPSVPAGPVDTELFPATGRTRRLLSEEIVVVLSLSLLASAVFAIIDLLSAPIAGQVRVTFRQEVQLEVHVASIVFSSAPVALVLYLARRSGESLEPFGLGTRSLRADVAWGIALGVSMAAAGLAIYVVSVRLGLNRFVIPVPPLGHWWSIPVLLLGSLRAGLLEEVIVAGYLIRRLEQVGVATLVAVAASALLRGAYHLYQGWGGFVGNLLLGLFFGYAFARWRRTWPLVAAHFVLDALAGLAYVMFRGTCHFGICIP
jgi:membrane protease YdiL (CAAX protease family)